MRSAAPADAPAGFAVCLSGSSTRMDRSTHAFGLLEIIAVLAIVMVLATMAFPQYEKFVAKAQETACIANMRSLHVALNAYLNDHGDVWPQEPTDQDKQVWSQFWLNTLSPYGPTSKTWQCPTLVAFLKQYSTGSNVPELHYVPSRFASTPGIARRWTTQPWLIEVADAHGKGPLICFPDGRVKSTREVFAENGL
jgi:type II secretory pathway pseudopilin PulG